MKGEGGEGREGGREGGMEGGGKIRTLSGKGVRQQRLAPSTMLSWPRSVLLGVQHFRDRIRGENVGIMALLFAYGCLLWT